MFRLHTCTFYVRMFVVLTAATFAAAATPVSMPSHSAVAAVAQQDPRVPRGQTLGTFKGHGSRVVSVRVPAGGPLVITASHNGSANFIIHMVGNGTTEYLVNEIGPWVGQAVFPEAKPGRYRIAVEADGSWGLVVTRPIPGPSAKAVPATFSGRGSRVIQIRALEDLQPVVTAKHRGEANFVVWVIGYGTLNGQILAFNEIGNFQGQTLIDDMPGGSYLLAIQADGPWTVRFQR